MKTEDRLKEIFYELITYDDDLPIDEEQAHIQADKLLLEVIMLLAKNSKHKAVCADIVSAFDKVGKWYS